MAQGKLDTEILCGNILDIEVGTDPGDIKKVLITDYGSTNEIHDVEYSLWTADSWQRLDYRGNVIDSEENPYGVLPFVALHDYPHISGDFWLPGGSDLISQQEMVNIKLTDLGHLIYFQSFGVGYIRDSSTVESRDTAPIGLGPGSLVELSGADSEIGFVSQKAEITSVVNAIYRIIKWSCVAQGLSAASVSTDTNEASGVSKTVDSI